MTDAQTGMRAGEPSTTDEGTSTGDQMRQQASDMADNVADRTMSTANDVADKAKEMAPQARDAAYNTAESGRESTAGALDRAAGMVKDRADGSSGMTAVAADRAAEGMEAAAGYLHEHDTAEIWDDVERYVRQHPMQSVAAAVATGILVGRIMR